MFTILIFCVTKQTKRLSISRAPRNCHLKPRSKSKSVTPISSLRSGGASPSPTSFLWTGVQTRMWRLNIFNCQFFYSRSRAATYDLFRRFPVDGVPEICLKWVFEWMLLCKWVKIVVKWKLPHRNLRPPLQYLVGYILFLFTFVNFAYQKFSNFFKDFSTSY